ncbi:MAG: AMP-binding enzyme [Streptosporangiaceae bacterium]
MGADEAGEMQVSEAQIAVHWREEERYYPPAKTIWGQPERYLDIYYRKYCPVKPGISPGPETEIGKIARPKNVWIVPDMPKTRSGKIMRRVIAGVSNFTDVGDITTLANPEIVDQIRDQVQSAKQARGEVPRQQSAAEAEEISKFGSTG